MNGLLLYELADGHQSSFAYFVVFLFFFVHTDPQEGSILGDGFIQFAFTVSLFLKIVCPCALPLCDLFPSLAPFAHLGRVAFALLRSVLGFVWVNTHLAVHSLMRIHVISSKRKGSHSGKVHYCIFLNPSVNSE